MLSRFLIATALIASASAASAGNCRPDLENRCRASCSADAARSTTMDVYSCYSACRFQFGCQRSDNQNFTPPDRKAQEG